MQGITVLHRRLSAAALALSVGGCAAKPAPARQTTVPVEVAVAEHIQAPVEITANGIVDPLQSVAVEAQVGGTLTEVGFREGDAVTAGQVLFRLDARPFQSVLRQAEAVLARDQVQAANARRDADRYRVLVDKDYVTRAQADQMEAAAAALHATLVSDSAAVESARLSLAYTTITAPIAGRTGSLLVRQGNLVRSNGSPLVVINQIQPILVRFPVAQADFAELRRRAAAGGVVVRAASNDGKPVADVGRLSFLDNAVDSLTGTVTAKAEFGNGGGALWPGEFVRVTALLSTESNVVAVPSSAIVAGQEGTFVFVVGGDTAAMRPVTAGRQVGERTIVARGLAAGERVVTDGQSRLTPGARIDIKTAATEARAELRPPVGRTTP